jgi:hypothetical protein
MRYLFLLIHKIYVELFGGDLKKALASASSSSDSSIKLTKNALNLPLLVFTCQDGSGIVTRQEVPVRVLSPSQALDIREPTTPTANVNITLPPLSSFRCGLLSNSLRPIIERTKSISDYITIQANKSGKLVICAETDNATIETFFSKYVRRFNIP